MASERASMRKSLYDLIAAETAYLEADGDPKDAGSPAGRWLRKKSARFQAILRKGEALEAALGRLLPMTKPANHEPGCGCVYHEAVKALAMTWDDPDGR